MADIHTLRPDAVFVSRRTLDAIAEALASVMQLSGESLSVLIDRLDRDDGDPDLEDDDPDHEHDGREPEVGI